MPSGRQSSHRVKSATPDENPVFSENRYSLLSPFSSSVNTIRERQKLFNLQNSFPQVREPTPQIFRGRSCSGWRKQGGGRGSPEPLPPYVGIRSYVGSGLEDHVVSYGDGRRAEGSQQFPPMRRIPKGHQAHHDEPAQGQAGEGLLDAHSLIDLENTKSVFSRANPPKNRKQFSSPMYLR